jgi:CRISPR/Cas system endoribonuclease Cas6 (RAMP superfamily)
VEQLRLGLDTLRELDRGINVHAVDVALMQAVNDVLDRPTEAKPRTVTIQIEVVPQVTQDMRLVGVTTQFQVITKTPNRRSEPYVMKITRDGLFFNPDNLRDDAPTLPYHDERSDR